jgi:cytochrome c-type biogenesis protein CcmF
VSSPSSGNRVTLSVRVNPLILWLWIGGGVMALGTILALAPRLRRRSRPVARDAVVPDRDPAPEDNGPGPPDELPSDELEGVRA